jgi:hypothetical protein
VLGPLAPGAQILVPAGPLYHVGGIAALLVLDGRIHLLTCGHLFTGPATQITCAAAGGPIAVLRRNYLLGEAPLDAAVCELTEEGRWLLAASTGAPTWLQGYCEPALEVCGWPAEFWPTHRTGASPRSMPISAHAAATSVLFPAGPLDGFVEVGGAVLPGDSGSLLMVDNLYFALCSGQVQGAWSYFTPIAAALDRVCDDHQDVAIWHPDSDLRQGV